MANNPRPNRYKILIERLFFNHWSEGTADFEFARDELESVATSLDMKLPKNLGDILYLSFLSRDGASS